MDASLVLTRPAPPPTTTANAPAAEPEQTDDDFAAHLPQEDAPQPTTRKPATRNVRADDDAPTSADTTTDEKSPDDIAAHSAASAPVLIRPQNSVVTFDLSAIVSHAGGDVAAVGAQAPTPSPAAATTPVSAAPVAPVLPQAQAGAAAVVPDGSMIPPEPTLDAGAAPNTLAQKSLETIALPGVAPSSADSRPQPRLRTTQMEGSEDKGVAKKATPYAGIEVATSTKSFAKVETSVAVQAVTATASQQDARSSSDAAPAALTAPSEHRAHQINEAVGSAGHRATTSTALVAQQIIRRFDGKSTSIDVRLDPAELGRVQVSLDVGADNKVTAVVAAENPATLADLVRSAKELERALQDAGLELASGGLSFDLAERGDNNASDEKSSGPRTSGRSDTADTAAPPQSRPFGLESWRGARVDVMV